MKWKYTTVKDGGYSKAVSGGIGKLSKSQVFVTGVKELDTALKELPIRLQKKALRPALRSSTKIVQSEIKKNAPRESGELVESLKVRSMKRSRVKIGVGISVGADYPDGGKLPYYAKWVELGTKERHHKSGKSVGRITSQSFMRRAIKAKRNEVVREFRDRLEVELAKVKAAIYIHKAGGGS